MSEKDRCLTALEELELDYRMSERVNKVYEAEIAKLRNIKKEQEVKIRELEKERKLLQIQIERGIEHGSK